MQRKDGICKEFEWKVYNQHKKSIKYFEIEIFYINHNENLIKDGFCDKQNEFLTFDTADYNRLDFLFQSGQIGQLYKYAKKYFWMDFNKK